MVLIFRGDEEVEVSSARAMLEAADAGKGDVRLRSVTTVSKQKEQQKLKLVTIEVPNPQPASILKRKRDPSASSSRPKIPFTNNAEKKTGGKSHLWDGAVGRVSTAEAHYPNDAEE